MLIGQSSATPPTRCRRRNEEVVKSKETIEQRLGRPVESFAYPYAFPEADASFKQRLRDMLCQAGYQGGVCTTLGRPVRGSDPFFLKRLPVNSCDDTQLFQAKLAGSYDWLGTPQYLVKMARHGCAPLTDAENTSTKGSTRARSRPV